MIYTRAEFWKSDLGDPEEFGNKYSLWVAHYGVNRPSLPKGWSKWDFWKYSDHGLLVGIDGNVDLDRFNGVFDDLHRFISRSAQEVFSDVPPDYWAKTSIDKVYELEIMLECGFYPLRFGPEEPVLRQDAAVFVLKTRYGKDFVPPAATGTVFNDVPKDHPYADWIEKLQADGFTSGRSTDPPLYFPGEKLTRAEMAVLKVRLTYGASFNPPNATGQVFQDVPATYWGAKWIEQLSRDGLAVGSSTNPPLYRPEDPVTRAEMAVFLMKTAEKRPGCGASLLPLANLLITVLRRSSRTDSQR